VRIIAPESHAADAAYLRKQLEAEVRGVPRDRRLYVINHVSDIDWFCRHTERDPRCITMCLTCNESVVGSNPAVAATSQVPLWRVRFSSDT
jgi:hypothetical protein